MIWSTWGNMLSNTIQLVPFIFATSKLPTAVDEWFQSPFKILYVTAIFVPSTFNSSSKICLDKISLTTIFMPNFKYYQTHTVMTWFIFTDAHINPVLLVLTSFFSLITFSDLLLLFVFTHKPCKVVGYFPSHSLYFFLFVQEGSVH